VSTGPPRQWKSLVQELVNRLDAPWVAAGDEAAHLLDRGGDGQLAGAHGRFAQAD
jgi:hypothetical protein